MKISPFKARTQSNPTEGVTFYAKDQLTIEEIAVSLSTLPEGALAVIRESLGREIVWLEQVGDWTEAGSDAEHLRTKKLQDALLTYQATYEARIVQQLRQQGKVA